MGGKGNEVKGRKEEANVWKWMEKGQGRRRKGREKERNGKGDER